MKKKILLIGGTGILGTAMLKTSLAKGYNVFVISNKESEIEDDNLTHLLLDKHSDDYALQIKAMPNFDFVYDIIEYNIIDAQQTLSLFKHKTSHIIILSTTLVYDREHVYTAPISELNDSIPLGTYGGYVDSKLEIEDFWLTQKEIDITILRPYHILGVDSLIGCLPLNNRDPLLLDKIEEGKKIKLFNGGNITFNYIHPEDLAEIVTRVANNTKCYNQAYNTLNPTVYSVKEYYLTIGKLLGKELTIEAIDYNEACENGWEMTLYPHCYDVKKLSEDINFTASIPLSKALQDALKSYPVTFTSVNDIPVFKAMNKGANPKRSSWIQPYVNLHNEKKSWDTIYENNVHETTPWTGHIFPKDVVKILNDFDKELDTYVIGCGTGDTLKQLENLNFNANHLIGSDISHVAIEEAKKRFPDYTFYETPTQHLKLANNAQNIFDWLNLHQIPIEELGAYLSAIDNIATNYLVCYIYDGNENSKKPSVLNTSKSIYMHSPALIKQHLKGYEVIQEFKYPQKSNPKSSAGLAYTVEVLWFQKAIQLVAL